MARWQAVALCWMAGLFGSTSAKAHDWYPSSCCSEKDPAARWSKPMAKLFLRQRRAGIYGTGAGSSGARRGCRPTANSISARHAHSRFYASSCRLAILDGKGPVVPTL